MRSGYCCGYDVYAGKGAPNSGDLCEVLELEPNLTQTTKIVIGVLAKCGLLEDVIEFSWITIIPLRNFSLRTRPFGNVRLWDAQSK